MNTLRRNLMPLSPVYRAIARDQRQAAAERVTMTVAAFVYDDYYCHGIKASFRGFYRDKDEAVRLLVGDRDGVASNLELMDMEGGGITKYRWAPYFDLKTKYDPAGETKWFMKRRWRDDAQWFELQHTSVRAGINDEFGEHTAAVRSGYWDSSHGR